MSWYRSALHRSGDVTRSNSCRLGPASALGLVNHLAEPGGALARATELARQIEANASLALRATRRILLASAPAPDEATKWKLSAGGFGEVMRSEDLKEGLEAFIQKRAPR